MKLSCSKDDLARALSICAKMVKTRVTLPVLSNIMIASDKDRIKLVATDLESSVSVWIDGKIDEEGAITLPARTFLEYVQSAGGATIKIDVENQDARLIGEGNNATIKGIAADEFPVIAPIKNENPFQIEANTLKEAILSVSSAAALDETRPVLAGLLFVGKKSLKIVATDSYRLAEYTLKLKSPIEFQAILPQRTVLELARILPQDSTPVEISSGENQVKFSCGDIFFLTRQIEGNFPDYEQIIPKDFVYQFNAPKEKFIEALKVANIFARESGNNIKLEGAESKVLLSAVSAQTGDSQATVNAVTTGTGLTISFNAKFLLDGISAIGKEEIKMQFSGPLSPGLLTGEGDSSFRYVIMPLRSE